MRSLELGRVDVKILIAAMILLALLLVLVSPDGFPSSAGFLDSGWPTPARE